MAPPNIPNLYRVAIEGQQGGLLCVNVVHVYKTGTTAAAIAYSVGSDWSTPMKGIQSSDFTYSQTVAQEMVPTSLPASDPTGGSGSQGSTGVPVGVALVATWRTALGGRSHRGRSYIPGVSNAYVNSSSSTWDDGSGDLQGAVDDFLGNLGADGIVPVVYSAKLQTYQQITSGTINLFFGSQRRRNIP